MTLRKSQANAIVLLSGIAVLGLAACVQENREARLEPTAAPGAISAPAPAQTPTYALFYMDEGASAKLAYGAANSDDVGLMMECAKGSRRVDISDVVRTSAAPTLTLASEGRRADLKAMPSSGDGVALLTAQTRADAPPLQAFRRSGRIDVAYAGTKYGIVASSAERGGVERFFAACEHAV